MWTCLCISLCFKTCLIPTVLHFVFMKWFVAMQIVGGKMDDSSKGRTWAKKRKLSNNFLYLCTDFLWIAWTLSQPFFSTHWECVCDFFSHLEKCFDPSSFQNNYNFGPFRLLLFFQYFSPNEIILQQKGQKGTGFSGPNGNEQKHRHKFIFFLYVSSCKMLV